MKLMSRDYEEQRIIAAQLYFKWLDKIGIIERLIKPETIASVSYDLGFPENIVDILEHILNYLSEFKIIRRAGGTYSLTDDLDRIRKKWSNKITTDPASPTVVFIKQGLKLVEDRFDGGTGEWDTVTNHFIIESVYTQESFFLNDPRILDTDHIYSYHKNPKIGIYGIFPQVCIKLIESIFNDPASITIITPSEEIKNQVISYCEFYEPARNYSSKVALVNDIVPNSMDLVFIPNGLNYGKPLKEQIKYLNRILRKDGIVYFRDVSNYSHQFGFEVLMTLATKFYNLEEFNDLNRMFKANGFSAVKQVSSEGLYVYAQKQE